MILEDKELESRANHSVKDISEKSDTISALYEFREQLFMGLFGNIAPPF